MKPINFGFKCLEAKGIDSSLLFTDIKVSIHEEYFLEKLLKFQRVFDFGFLRLCHIKCLFGKNKKLKQSHCHSFF